MKLRNGDPWMPAADYGKSLSGLGVNLLVADMDAERAFLSAVLEAREVYADPDFAAFEGHGAKWMLHADHTYADHSLSGSLTADAARGLGVELRLYGCDPDAAEARARARDDLVLAGAMDKPHGLREVYLISPAGYLWVPSLALGAKS